MLPGMTTEAKWSARVKAWRASGKTAAEYCEGREYKANSLRYWSSRLRKVHGDEATQDKGAVQEIRMARLVRSRGAVERQMPDEQETPIVIEVGSLRVGVRRGFDRGVLRDVLEALGGAR